MLRRLKLWWARRGRVVCARCRRVLARGQECGTAKVERQEFADGGWVEWRSWNPCSKHAPGGRVKGPKRLLDDDPDLDDVNAETLSRPNKGDPFQNPRYDDAMLREIAANGGVYG